MAYLELLLAWHIPVTMDKKGICGRELKEKSNNKMACFMPFAVIISTPLIIDKANHASVF